MKRSVFDAPGELVRVRYQRPNIARRTALGVTGRAYMAVQVYAHSCQQHCQNAVLLLRSEDL